MKNKIYVVGIEIIYMNWESKLSSRVEKGVYICLPDNIDEAVSDAVRRNRELIEGQTGTIILRVNYHYDELEQSIIDGIKAI